MNGEIQTKFCSFELETKEADDRVTISGYGSVANNVDFGGDLVEPGAFADAIKSGRKPKMLWQHDTRSIIGTWDSLEENSRGLKVSGTILTKLAQGAEAAILLREKAIDGLSIGYIAKEFEFKKSNSGMVRHIKAAELLEISVVTFPMNPKALVTDVKQLQSPREVETILRNAGVPGTFAKLVAIHGFEEAKARLAGDQREADDDRGKELQGLSALLGEIQRLKETLNAQG